MTPEHPDLGSFESLNINWFPGHMLKARKGVAEQIRRVDVVLELRDARLPQTSRNPELQEMLQNKPSLVLFNKTGLAEPQLTRQWENQFRQELSRNFLFIDVKTRRNLNRILPLAKQLMQTRWANLRQRGIRPPALRLMVIGIPNVGKSSLINALARRSATRTGPTPGVTRHQEWIVLGHNAELLDTPGILWPKIETTADGMNLTLTGAIKDAVVGVEHLANYLVQLGQIYFPSRLQQQYRLRSLELRSAEDLIIEVATHRGYLKAGGTIDPQRVSETILRDFRAGRFGPLTLDRFPVTPSVDEPHPVSIADAKADLPATEPDVDETVPTPEEPEHN